MPKRQAQPSAEFLLAERTQRKLKKQAWAQAQAQAQAQEATQQAELQALYDQLQVDHARL